jgi:hypothetical protein
MRIKFNIKIKWNKMMRDKIEESRTDKKPNKYQSKEWWPNWIYKTNKKILLYFSNKKRGRKKKVHQIHNTGHSPHVPRHFEGLDEVFSRPLWKGLFGRWRSLNALLKGRRLLPLIGAYFASANNFFFKKKTKLPLTPLDNKEQTIMKITKMPMTMSFVFFFLLRMI